MTGLRTLELGPGVHVVTDGLYQALVVADGPDVLVVDAPPSMSGLKDAVVGLTGTPITDLVYSHSHGDHIGAAAALAAGAAVRIHGHSRTAEVLTIRADRHRPVPTHPFTTESRLQVGRHDVVLRHLGGDHTPDNILVLLPGDGVAMLVDVVLPAAAPFRDLTVASDVPGFRRAHDDLLALDAERFLGGHFQRIGTRADVRRARDYLDDLAATTMGALRRVPPPTAGQRARAGHPYELAADRDKRVVDLVAPEILDRWAGVLAGLHVYVDSHVTAMGDALVYEYNVPAGGPAPGPRPAG